MKPASHLLRFTIVFNREELIKKDFGKPPYCLIVPSKLHFMEEDVLEQYR